MLYRDGGSGVRCRGVLSRVRVIAAFAFLLLACVAAPVFADSEEGIKEGSPPPSDSQGISSGEVQAPPPSGEVKAPPAPSDGSETEPPSLEEKPPQEEHGEEPTDGEEQEASTPKEDGPGAIGYTDLPPSEEAQLLREEFAPQLDAIDSDPSRALSDVELKKIASPTEALATVDGEKVIIDSSVPLRAENSDGNLGKVDLSLEEQADGYSPANPLVDVSLPKTADAPIQVGNAGLTLTAVGADPTALARPLGEESLFVPEVAEDASLLLSPISGGVELSAMLASAESPHQLEFAVTLPPNTQLVPAEGGANVVDDDGTVLDRITAPKAVDADGNDLSVALIVKEGAIVLSLSVGEAEPAYPIYVDPEVIEENWWGFADTSKLFYWNWQWAGVPSAETYIGQRSPIVDNWGNGLYVRSKSATNYPAGSYGRWWFAPQGATTYMRRVILGPMHYDAHGCTANEPHPYIGVWNNGGFWSVLNNAYPTGWATWIDTGEGNLGAGAHTAFVGIEAAGAVNLKCGHDYALNGAVLYLTDPENPTVSPAGGIPGGWVNASTGFTISLPVSDPGLGVKSARISPDGSPEIPQTLSCTGSVASPCPATYTFLYPVSGSSFDEGEKQLRFSARDALEKTSNTYEATVRVDRTPPEVTLDGQLAEATDEVGGKKAEEEDPTKFDALSLPVYNLAINAVDGSTASGATKRSGVKSIEVFLDKGTTPVKSWTESSCPLSSCGMSKVFTLKLNELSAEIHHTLLIKVQDFAGNAPREREIGFEYVPATGLKPDYTLQHFVLGPTPTGESSAALPELAVNVVNGNLVYHQQDVEVADSAANLEIERFYNSLLPASQNSEWGDGWTLAQTPSLTVNGGQPNEATVVEDSGAVESAVAVPTTVGQERFDPQLQAVITKEASGYALTDESGESEEEVTFNQSGAATSTQTGEFGGLDYSYSGGELSKVEVENPASGGGVAPTDPPKSVVSSIPSYASAIGSAGSGPGQFSRPADVEVDPSGNIWVVDRWNNRVQQFNAKGEFIKAIGTGGNKPGQVAEPKGIAFTASGEFWIADTGNSRIELFNAKGEFVKAVGKAGTGNGQFSQPEAVAVDANGNVWVADTYNYRIQEFSPSGEFIKVVNPPGLGAIEPTSIAFGPESSVWVTDWQHNRVVELNEAGDFVRQFGSEGTGNGQFKRPDAVVVDGSGDLWVLDQQNSRVQEFSQTGKYLGQFGAAGSGPGQFSFTYPNGMAVDTKGNIWVVDTLNNRVQKWTMPKYAPTFASTFGSSGRAVGQFSHPGDVAMDPEGNLWVADVSNNRLEQFNPRGEYIKSLGSAGVTNGKFSGPKSLAFSQAGSLWVADSGNNRLQKFNAAGEFVKAVGSAGVGNGQLYGPEAIGIDARGHIWVCDTYNFRIQEFNANGEFIRVVNPPALGAIEPTGIDFGPGGTVWIADWSHNRVVELNEAGEFLRQVGTGGTGNGQFAHPDGVAVDNHGTVWVGDQSNSRVQGFNQSGEYVTQFGAAGSGAGQFKFSYPVGLAADGRGGIWVTDTNNNRIQKWETPQADLEAWEREVAAQIKPPSVSVDTSGGLVELVKGRDAGEVAYTHSGELLTAVSGPDGETKYEYDSAGKMTKVTLPHGTYAQIAYEPTYGRVKSVTVSIEGAKPKTTTFAYTDEPRSTKVEPEGEVATTYQFRADGSVFKWSNTSKPPVFDDISGTLHDPADLETAQPITPGVHNLVVQAFNAEGIASIQVVANGSQLVSEKTCTKSRAECETVRLEWVTETQNWPPGIVYLEVIATGMAAGKASQKFWVNIPYTPPPPPGVEPTPTYSEIRQFRERFGLDFDLTGSEEAINDRIFDLIGDWNNANTPAGEVARATRQSWGVPLRPVDAAELEYRESYVAQAATAIPQWAAANGASSAYAGYYVDHRAGGLVFVGFTGSQAERVTALKQAGVLMAPDRVRPFPSQPAYTLAYLEGLQLGILEAPGAPATSIMGGASVNVEKSRVDVGAANVAQVEAFIASKFPGAPVVVHYEPTSERPKFKRIKATQTGPVKSGEMLGSTFPGEPERINEECSVGWGAWDRGGTNPDGSTLYRFFITTAGHCFAPGEEVKQWERDAEGRFLWQRVIGYVRRYSFNKHPSNFATDAEAIRIEDPGILPRLIRKSDTTFGRINGTSTVTEGMLVCRAGQYSPNVKCGSAEWPPKCERWGELRENGDPVLCTIRTEIPIAPGDSGGPYWERATGNAVGTLTGGIANASWFTPVLELPGYAKAQGSLNALGVEGEPLHLVRWKP